MLFDRNYILVMLDTYLDKSGISQAEFAAQLNVHPSLIWQWLNKERPISAIKAREIEGITGGELTRYMLRPDVFGTDPTKKKTRA